MFKYEERPHPMKNGVQRLYCFENGYGASCVRWRGLGYASMPGGGSYTTGDDEWEVAVVKMNGEWDFNLCYDTPITNDVIGHIKDGEELEELLTLRISQLPPIGKMAETA